MNMIALCPPPTYLQTHVCIICPSSSDTIYLPTNLSVFVRFIEMSYISFSYAMKYNIYTDFTTSHTSMIIHQYQYSTEYNLSKNRDRKSTKKL